MARKTRRFLKKRRASRKRRTMRKRQTMHRKRGGAPPSLPPNAVVIWRQLQDDEDAVPVVTDYQTLREDLELDAE
jgi:hypothetical protein